jgi:hypothetical protein
MKQIFLLTACFMQLCFLHAQSEQQMRDALKRLLWAIKNASQTLLSLLESFKIGIITFPALVKYGKCFERCPLTLLKTIRSKKNHQKLKREYFCPMERSEKKCNLHIVLNSKWNNIF